MSLTRLAKLSTVYAFYIGREFQESFGWLISLLNDRYRKYHIQESGFHKTCNDYFLANERHSNFPPQAYFHKGDREKTLTTILELYHNTDVKLPFLVKLAQSYYTDADET